MSNAMPGAGTLNPALLLNPRAAFLSNGSGGSSSNGSGKMMTAATPSMTNGFGVASASSEGAPALEFQFSHLDDTGSASASASGLSRDNSPPDSLTTSTNHMTDMVERLNNVEDRPMAPRAKRRRLDADGGGLDASANVKGKPGRFGNGSNGIIGQHLKSRQDGTGNGIRNEMAYGVTNGVTNEAANGVANGIANGMANGIANGTIPAATIDLTDGNQDDDDDIVEITSSTEEEVCFGMIQGAKVNCHVVPSPKPGAISIMNDSWWPHVKIILNRRINDPNNIIVAKDHSRREVGRLDADVAAGLTPLLESRLQLRTDCRIPSRQKRVNEEVGQQTSTSYNLDLMLYGPRKCGKIVARHLSQKQLWLRNPPRVDAGIRFDNPQAIEGPKPPLLQKDARATPTQPHNQPVVRTVEEIRSEVMGLFDTLTKSEDLPEMNPDGRIKTELLKHQKQGLYFMTTKELPRDLSTDGKSSNSFWQIRRGKHGQKTYYNVITGESHLDPPPETLGGILADMMGLGKTLSILSLVVSTLDTAKDWCQAAPAQPQPPPPKKSTASSRNSFHVPSSEPLGLTQLKKNAQATLLVCPLSTITNWEEQIKMHMVPGSFKYYIYHGSNRIKDVAKLSQFDIVITTYGSVASEVTQRQKNRKGPHPLEEIGWFRIVLDEAHQIREQSTLQFKAICRLQANRRWAVTGTPVQNKLDDLAALLAFIRLKPFDERNKFNQAIVTPFKICDPEIVPKLRVLVDSVTLRRLKDKIDLPPRTDHLVRLPFSQSEAKLYKIFERNALAKVTVLERLGSHPDRVPGGKTYIHILQSILRLRLVSAHGRELLNEDDLAIVQGMTQDSAIDIDSEEDAEDKPVISETRAYEVYELMQETGTDRCNRCNRRPGYPEDGTESDSEDSPLAYLSACYHLLCTSCKPTWDEECGNGQGACPFCGQHIRFTLFELRKDRANHEHDSRRHSSAKPKRVDPRKYGGPHTKTRALVDDLLKTKAESEANPDEPPFKSVVFSTWTSHLDLVEVALDKAKITHTRLDGKMTRLARTAAMENFREDDSIQVMLVSIMAGGLGLNLTAANHVYVMEPQYNPAAEAQAVDRVHRLGQKRPVRTVRYIMEGSIEEKMLELQEKKKKLASLSMDKTKMDKAEAAKEKLMDLRSLFK